MKDLTSVRKLILYTICSVILCGSGYLVIDHYNLINDIKTGYKTLTKKSLTPSHNTLNDIQSISSIVQEDINHKSDKEALLLSQQFQLLQILNQIEHTLSYGGDFTQECDAMTSLTYNMSKKVQYMVMNFMQYRQDSVQSNDEIILLLSQILEQYKSQNDNLSPHSASLKKLFTIQNISDYSVEKVFNIAITALRNNRLNEAAEVLMPLTNSNKAVQEIVLSVEKKIVISNAVTTIKNEILNNA